MSEAWHKYRKQIQLELLQLYGKRESENIADYYIAARRGETISSSDFSEDLKKMKDGIPIQQIVNLSFFYGKRFFVNEHVLIPRPETEELVHWILSDHKGLDSEGTLLDIGTGSGCILLSIISELDKMQGIGLDVSELAISVAERNRDALGLSASFIKRDIMTENLADLPALDIIVSNPPYILTSEVNLMDKSTLDYEPKLALFVEGDDPFVFYKRIIELASVSLKPKGLLYFETSHLYSDMLQAYLEQKALNYKHMKDLQGRPRMLKISF